MRTLNVDTVNQVGKKVTLQGWINTRRDHGKITFLDLRDRTGIVQLVSSQKNADARPESVVEVVGTVQKRPDNLVNKNIATGTVEVVIDTIRVISKSRELPFPIDTDGYEIDEEIRNKYRYLDIRRTRLIRNLRIRSGVVAYIRNFLLGHDFVEIETPILTKTTPEGARDFIVPSRLQHGKFYALPQSPQQYKQLLMVAGVERYFQIARCFRDEDPRKDRAYGEFTQLDMEMSFVTQEDILQLTEELYTGMVRTLFPGKHMSQTPWPRLTHSHVQKTYGTDKPDLRKDKNDPDELAFAWILEYPLFTRQSQEDFYHGSGTSAFAPSHHMFTAPHPDDTALLDTDPTKVRGLQHDMVLNGYEVGGGSVRIHEAHIQEKVFDLIGFTKEQKKQFDHMLTAFSYGVPPHGGIAPGIDRFVMAVLGEPSIREVMAFPASSSGAISVMDAPSAVTAAQLQELGISVGHTKPAGGQQVYDRIVALLDAGHCTYQAYEHEPVYTSQDAARVRKTDLKEGLKALVLVADDNPIMVVVPGDRKINFPVFKKLFGIKDLRMATAEEVSNITSVPIGAVPPFGNVFLLKTYMDEHVRENTSVVFNAGLHTKSIQMKAADYEAIVKPAVGIFS